MKKITALFLTTIFLSTNCLADKVCLKVAIKNGQAKTKVKTIPSTENCTGSFKQVVDTDVLAGPAGATGATGEPGSSLFSYTGGTGSSTLTTLLYYPISGIGSGAVAQEGTSMAPGSSCSSLEVTVQLDASPGSGNSRTIGLYHTRPGFFGADKVICTISDFDSSCTTTFAFPDGFGNSLQATDFLSISEDGVVGSPFASPANWSLKCLAS